MAGFPKCHVTVNRPLSVVGLDYTGLFLSSVHHISTLRSRNGISGYLFAHVLRLFALNYRHIFQYIFSSNIELFHLVDNVRTEIRLNCERYFSAILFVSFSCIRLFQKFYPF